MAAVWGLFYPRPYQLAVAVLAALPIIALLLMPRTKGLYQIDGRRDDARPSVAIPFIIPSAILALRATTDFHFLDWKSFLACVIIAAAFLTFLIARSEPIMRKHRFTIFSMFLFSSAYAFGALAQADTLFDQSARRTFEVTVLSKRSTRGRKSTTWYLHVMPWGPQTNPDDISVSRPLYTSVSPGQSVCIRLASGTLKIRWYVVTPCHEPN